MEIVQLRPTSCSVKMDIGEMLPTTGVSRWMYPVTGTSPVPESASTVHPTTTCRTDHVSPTRNAPTGSFSTMVHVCQFPWLA